MGRGTLAFGPNEPRLQKSPRALQRTYFKHKQTDSSIPSIRLGTRGQSCDAKEEGGGIVSGSLVNVRAMILFFPYFHERK